MLVKFLNFFEEFRQPSWDSWKAILAKLTPQVREFYAICGRGAGKSRIIAAIACFFATQRNYTRVPGERIYVGVIAPDRKQATTTLNYIRGLLLSVPELGTLIETETAESIDLVNGVTVEVVTATVSAPRGRAYALVIVEEAAFLPQDASANPDAEVIAAVAPALARVPGSLLCVISSPYARRGVIWDAWKNYHDTPVEDVLLVQAATLDLNPLFDQAAIARAYEKDPARAAAEYGAQFRSDVETFVSREVLDHNVQVGRFELPPMAVDTGVRYVAFVDPSGGSADSFTLAIAHKAGVQTVIDVVRERKPPFSPESVIREYADLLKRYRIAKVVGDRYGGEFPRELFRKHGIAYVTSEKTKNDLYRDLLSRLNSGGVELLDHPKLLTQLASLERRVGRGGKDSIDHPPRGHDDVANAVAGVCEGTGITTRKVRSTWGDTPSRPSQDLNLREVSPGVWRYSMPRGYRGRPPSELVEEISRARLRTKERFE